METSTGSFPATSASIDCSWLAPHRLWARNSLAAAVCPLVIRWFARKISSILIHFVPTIRLVYPKIDPKWRWLSNRMGKVYNCCESVFYLLKSFVSNFFGESIHGHRRKKASGASTTGAESLVTSGL